ncbi:hypothetical protein D9M72_504150 [compost metagenome]
MQRQPAGDFRDVHDGLVGAKPFDVQHFIRIQDAQRGGMLHNCLDVLHEGQGGLPQSEHLGPAGDEFPHPGADVDVAAWLAFEEPFLQQVVDQPVGGGYGQPGPAPEFGDAHGSMAVVEGAHDFHEAPDD